MKLSALKRAGVFGKPQKTLLDAFFMFIPFLDTVKIIGISDHI